MVDPRPHQAESSLHDPISPLAFPSTTALGWGLRISHDRQHHHHGGPPSTPILPLTGPIRACLDLYVSGTEIAIESIGARTAGLYIEQ